MKIGYNKILGIIFILCSLLSCCLIVLSTQIKEKSIGAGFAGAFWICLIIGILMLSRDYIEITKDKIIVKTLIGLNSKTYPFSPDTQLVVENEKLFIVNNEIRQAIPLSVFTIDKRAWKELKEKIVTHENLVK